MRRRFKFYLESSFWKRLVDPANPRMRKVSYQFLRAVAGRHRIITSRLVRAELHATPDLVERRAVTRHMERVRMRAVPTTALVTTVRDEILEEGGWGANRLADMLHVAYTVIARADALVTWDQDDLARERTRRVVQAVCRRRGLKAPRIGMPEEVAAWFGLMTR